MSILTDMKAGEERRPSARVMVIMSVTMFVLMILLPPVLPFMRTAGGPLFLVIAVVVSTWHLVPPVSWRLLLHPRQIQAYRRATGGSVLLALALSNVGVSSESAARIMRTAQPDVDGWQVWGLARHCPLFDERLHARVWSTPAGWQRSEMVTAVTHTRHDWVEDVLAAFDADPTFCGAWVSRPLVAPVGHIAAAVDRVIASDPTRGPATLYRAAATVCQNPSARAFYGCGRDRASWDTFDEQVAKWIETVPLVLERPSAAALLITQYRGVDEPWWWCAAGHSGPLALSLQDSGEVTTEQVRALVQLAR